MRILHVSEALGGGIMTALVAMVESTPEIEHHLLASPRPDIDTGTDLGESFASVRTIPRRPVAALRALRRALVDLDPDLVHAHSSFAGLLVRAVPLTGQPVVYSPHGFAFERRDVTPWQRRAFWQIERALARRTDLLVAVSPFEAESGHRLGHARCSYMPNRASLHVHATARHALPLRITTAGRICPAKDWRYFLHVKRYAETELGLDAEWEWLGGGSDDDEDALRSAGVKVSGWIDRRDLLPRLGAAQVYLHTAAWDAAPITVLEAAGLGLPMVIRSIPSLNSLRLPGTRAGAAAIGRRLVALQDADVWQGAQADSARLLDRHSRLLQGRQLRAAYRQLAVRPTSRLPLSVVSEPVRVMRAVDV